MKLSVKLLLELALLASMWAAATIAAPITDHIKNLSQSVPENPQNNIDFWFSTLLVVASVSIAVLLVAGVVGTIAMGKTAKKINK